MPQATIIIGLVLQIVSAAATLGPAFKEIAAQGKAIIDSLFTAKLISKEQQDAAKANVDSIQALVDAGIIPEHWQVEPNPE